MNNIEQATCKFKVAKYDWNVAKLDNSQNVWGWKMTRFVFVLTTLDLNTKSSKRRFKK